MTPSNGSNGEARELIERAERDLASEIDVDEAVELAADLLRALQATLPPQDSSGDARELLAWLYERAAEQDEDWAGDNQPVEQGGPGSSGRPMPRNFYLEAARALEAALSRQVRSEGVGQSNGDYLGPDYFGERPTNDEIVDEATAQLRADLAEVRAALGSQDRSPPDDELTEALKRHDRSLLVDWFGSGLGYSVDGGRTWTALASRSAPDGWVPSAVLRGLLKAYERAEQDGVVRLNSETAEAEARANEALAASPSALDGEAGQ